jgi:hypothetical protein
MKNKLFNLVFTASACFLITLADATMTTTSLIFHGEPDCPKELLK